jgi:hypothetical protein
MILMPDKISEFVIDLGARPDTHGTSNPYRRIDCRLNLENYLRAMVARPGRRILVVAEALGYRGGGLTGIPISSENLLRLAPHPFLRALRESLQIDGNTSEATATMVWDTLAGRRRIPLFWNAFPFHPIEAMSQLQTGPPLPTKWLRDRNTWYGLPISIDRRLWLASAAKAPLPRNGPFPGYR